MGETVEVGDFCKKILKDNLEYARALVDKEQKKVKCVKARRVVMSYECSGQEGLCADKEIGCYKLGEKLASNLRIVHASLIPNNGSSKLNCYFSSLSDKEVLKPRF